MKAIFSDVATWFLLMLLNIFTYTYILMFICNQSYLKKYIGVATTLVAISWSYVVFINYEKPPRNMLFQYHSLKPNVTNKRLRNEPENYPTNLVSINFVKPPENILFQYH